MKSLNQIAITYSETGDRRFAIRIYEQLMKYPRNRLFNNEALLTVTPMLCYNFSRLLGRERRYEECIEIAQYGYDISLKYDKARVLGGLLLNIGYSLEKLYQGNFWYRAGIFVLNFYDRTIDTGRFYNRLHIAVRRWGLVVVALFLLALPLPAAGWAAHRQQS